MWATIINLNGVYNENPVEVTQDESSGNWYDEEGELRITKSGLLIERYTITFSSESKEEVQIFINGAKSMCTLLNNLGWCVFETE